MKEVKNVKKQTITTKMLALMVLIGLCVVLTASSVSAASTVYVNVTGGNDSNTGTIDNPYQTMAQGISSVDENGTVKLADGVYSGTGNTNITINKNMTIQGLSQNGTIINGTDTNWIFTITPGVNVTIQNLTFTNGIAYDGGAILNHGILSISDCTFTENTATHWGGAIYSDSFKNIMSLTDCTFTKNTALYGGGAIAYLSICNVTNCTFMYNSVIGGDSWCGGAIGAYSLSNSTVTGCTFVGNSVDPIPSSFGGGAIYVYNAALTANFNRFYNNSARLGSAFAYNVGINRVINAENNWWGSNVDPTTVTNLIYGPVDANPWVILTVNATPSTINNTQTSSIIVSFNNHSSDGSSSSPLDPSNGHIPDGLPVTFSLIGNILGSLNEPLTVTTTNGTAHILFTSCSAGIQQINATTDKQNVSAYVTILPASFVEISKEFRDLPWGSVITTAYYNDKIYAIVKMHNLGPDTTSINVRDLLNGLTWTGNYYVYRTVGSYPNTESAWVFNDPNYTFNGTDWNVGSLSTMIGSQRWLAIEVIVNQTGTVSNYAETLNQSTSPYQGYANYTAYLTSDSTPTTITVNPVSGFAGQNVTFTVNLVDSNGNNVTDGQVTFTVNNTNIGTVNVSNGTAILTWTIPTNWTAGNYNVVANYSGSNYLASTNSTNLTVTPNPTTITMGSVSGYAGQNVTFTVNLVDSNGNNVTDGQVTFTVNNTNIGTVNVSNGTAILTWTIPTNWTAGNYNVVANYSGSNNYLNSTNNTLLTLNPSAYLYLNVTNSNSNPNMGETFLLTYKLSNNGPDNATNVTMSFQIPAGLEFITATVDNGTWTYNPANRTITWNLTNVAVGDPYLYLTVRASGAGSYSILPTITSDTFNQNTDPLTSFNLNVQTQNSDNGGSTANSATVNAASTTKTVPMQTTGVPIAGLVLAVLAVLGGTLAPRKK